MPQLATPSPGVSSQVHPNSVIVLHESLCDKNIPYIGFAKKHLEATEVMQRAQILKTVWDLTPGFHHLLTNYLAMGRVICLSKP